MFFKRLANVVLKTDQTAGFGFQQTRYKWVNAKMKRDFLRRELVRTENIKRLRLNGLRKNTILPKEIQSVADEEIAALPYRSSITHITNRCVITSRGRGVVLRWRLSRFIFRHLMDYNLMSGGQRAMW